MSELISVIIPAYNAVKHIETCLSSVLNQTYKNLEIIVINDGSTDGTKKILENFKLKDHRIKVIHKSNTGVSDTRNVGIKNALGKFIGFVDADDEVKPDMYEVLLSNLLKHSADISHCGFELVTQNSLKLFYGTSNVYIQSQKEALVSLLNANLFEPSCCSKLYKKEIVKNIAFTNEIKFNEDLLFNVDAFKKSHIIIFHDVSLYRYTYNPSSASRSTNKYIIQQHVLKAAELINEKLSGMNIDAARNRFYVGKLITIYKEVFNDTTNNRAVFKIREKLKNSSYKHLNLRTFYLRFTLLYFPFVYSLSQYIFDKTLGKNKKWSKPSKL